MNLKKGCVLCRDFMSIYKINRTLHGRLGIRILSLSAESISHSFALLIHERYFQHSKIKFVFPCSHVISSIFTSPYEKINSQYNCTFEQLLLICYSVHCVYLQLQRFVYNRGGKKIFYSRLLKLAFTSPNVIPTSPKSFLTSRIDSTGLHQFEFLKKHHLPIGQVNPFSAKCEQGQK